MLFYSVHAYSHRISRTVDIHFIDDIHEVLLRWILSQTPEKHAQLLRTDESVAILVEYLEGFLYFWNIKKHINKQHINKQSQKRAHRRIGFRDTRTNLEMYVYDIMFA